MKEEDRKRFEKLFEQEELTKAEEIELAAFVISAMSAYDVRRFFPEDVHDRTHP